FNPVFPLHPFFLLGLPRGPRPPPDDAQRWAEVRPNDSWAIPGTGNGRAYVMTEPGTEPGIEPGFAPEYSAEAHAWRGDIAMSVWVTGREPVPKKRIMDVAERQMERL
ncbi:hypothetical protein ACFW05_01810, partial [Streptomyces albogriseolus]